MKKYIFMLLFILFVMVSASAQQQEAAAGTASAEKPFDESEIILDQPAADTASAENAASGSSFLTTWDFIKVIIILAVVVLIVYGIFYFLRKLGGTKFQNNDLIKIIGTQSLSQNNSIHVIEVGAKYYLIGSSEGSVSHLADIDDKESIDSIILNKNEETAVKRSFSDFIMLTLGKNTDKKTDIKSKITNNNKFIKDQAERLKKM